MKTNKNLETVIDYFVGSPTLLQYVTGLRSNYFVGSPTLLQYVTGLRSRVEDFDRIVSEIHNKMTLELACNIDGKSDQTCNVTKHYILRDIIYQEMERRICECICRKYR